MKIKIAIIILATAKYVIYVPNLVQNIKKYFLINSDVSVFLLTDCKAFFENVIQHNVEHHSWPYSTLLRYHKYKTIFKQLQDFEYIFHIDADMEICDHINDDILSNLTLTNHPAFYDKPSSQFPYDDNPISTSYMNTGLGEIYFAGGFLGAKKELFFDLAESIIDKINYDLKNNYIAKWHDESYLQKYAFENKPNIVLSPSYCYPQYWKLPFDQKIICLQKDHNLMRKKITKIFI
jgi:histo-blood group ABO system transferase